MQSNLLKTTNFDFLINLFSFQKPKFQVKPPMPSMGLGLRPIDYLKEGFVKFDENWWA